MMSAATRYHMKVWIYIPGCASKIFEWSSGYHVVKHKAAHHVKDQ